MKRKLAELKKIIGEVSDLNAAASLLGWDQQTLMAPGSTEGRGQQLSTLEMIAHDRFTAPKVGRLLEALLRYAEGLDPESDDACMIRRTWHDYQKATKVPSKMVVELAQARTAAAPAWQTARSQSKFELFRPSLERLFDLSRRYAELFAPYDHPYDALLDDYEPGLKTADVKEIFTALRPQQVALLHQIAASPQVDDAFIWQDYDEQKQWDFGVDVITKFGFDWQRGRQDKSPHPFTSNFGVNDVRITTRFLPNNGVSALFSTLHEAGHAMYEQGVAQALDRTLLGGGASLAVHESQSRLWENLVGRSLPFWEYFYPRFQNLFPQQLHGVSLEKFYRGINRVQPSLTRVEADEATYNMHVMLRLELEMALIEGNLAFKDLPEAWNARMQEYLGIVPPDDAQGVLQDIHWSMGLIGYFSTYALGNLVSGQLWECIYRAMPDLDEQFRRGEFGNLLAWLRENIHQHGRKFTPQDLVQRVTGSKIDPAPYLRYLQVKYSKIYGF